MNADQPRQPLSPQLCPKCKAKTIKVQPFCVRCKMDLYHGQAKKQKRGLCIYCERHKTLSEEHIFPRWLRNHYPCRHKTTTHHLSRPERYAFWEQVQMHSQVGWATRCPRVSSFYIPTTAWAANLPTLQKMSSYKGAIYRFCRSDASIGSICAARLAGK